MQDFVRRKNIEHLTKQLAGGRLDAALHDYAEKRLAEELAGGRAEELASARAHGHQPDDAAELVPSSVKKADGTEAPC